MAEGDTINEGGCMCGAVRFRLHGPFTYSAHCHCRSCQRAVGAGYATYSAVEPENFEIIKGDMTIYHSSPGVRRGFCSQCGTSLSYSGDDWTDYAIMSATLDDPSAAMPTSNAYTKDRLPWVALDESLKNYHEFP
ncbi:MAG: GFA family protein [Rhizobiaceae bacterium]